MTEQRERGALMRSEIAEQPDAWLRLLGSQRESMEAAAALLETTDPQLIVFAARGTSDHAAMYAQYLVHVRLGIPAMLATPSAFTAYGAELRYPRAVMIAVSQSGESPDLIETVRRARSSGVPVISITNVATSTVAALGNVHIDLSAGPELSVAATKTYTNELLALRTLIELTARRSWESITKGVGELVDAGRRLLVGEAGFGSLLELMDHTTRVLVVGRGYSMGSAREGALKLMETNGIAASGWSAADATHGPLGQVDGETVVVLLTAGQAGRESVEAFGRAAAALGGRVITIGPSSGADTLVIPAEGIDEALLPMLEILPIQRLALEAALRRGLDPDAPVGLAKVTRTL